MASSLAVSDILVALVLIPSYLACVYFICEHRLLKIFYDGFLYVSACNLCSITFDRYLAITHPLKYVYHTRIIQLPVKTMITSWISPITISLVPITWSYSSSYIEAQKVNNKIYYTIQVALASKKIQQIRREIQSGVSATTIYPNPISATSAREGKASLRVFSESKQKLKYIIMNTTR